MKVEGCSIGLKRLQGVECRPSGPRSVTAWTRILRCIATDKDARIPAVSKCLNPYIIMPRDRIVDRFLRQEEFFYPPMTAVHGSCCRL